MEDMFGRRSTDPHATTETVRGRSLARGPAWIVGLVLSAAGLALFFRAPGTPLSFDGFPDGVATGDTFLGFEANAWTAWLTTAAGILVLIGAAQHLLARTFSLIVGLALGAASVIALFDGDDVLGLAAANGWTALGWGVASAILLITALLPRVTHEREVATTQRDGMTDRDRIAERDRARIADREHAHAAERDRTHDVDQDRDRDLDRNAEPAHPMSEHADRPAAQPAATTSEERAGGAPPVRSAPLRHTYEPRTQESETTTGARSAQDADAETRR